MVIMPTHHDTPAPNPLLQGLHGPAGLSNPTPPPPPPPRRPQLTCCSRSLRCRKGVPALPRGTKRSGVTDWAFGAFVPLPWGVL